MRLATGSSGRDVMLCLVLVAEPSLLLQAVSILHSTLLFPFGLGKGRREGSRSSRGETVSGIRSNGSPADAINLDVISRDSVGNAYLSA